MTLIRLDLARRPFLDGRGFGEVGPFEELSGEAEFAVDPAHPRNCMIADLELAPRDAAGRVHFTSDVRILQPINGGSGKRGLFLDVVNRGNSIFARMLEPGPLGPTTGVTEGFLMCRGFTVVTCGWQHDIPRGGELFGLSAPLAQGVGAPLTGLGFLALRDVVSHVRRTHALDFALAMGASQSARLLRHLVFLGAAEDEAGRQALDGLLIVAAGARLTEANLRFGEPSSNGPRATMPPYRYSELLQHRSTPKIIHMDTSSEYCSSAAEHHVSAAVGTISDDERTDAEIPDNVRIYLCASTQHAPAPLDAGRDARAVNPPNTIDYKPFVRAAVDNLAAWCSSDLTPPQSAYPRFADRTLTADLRPSVDDDGNEVPGLRHPDVAVPLATYTGWNPSAGDPTVLVRALGSTIPFDPELVGRRYPSPDVFLSDVRRAAEALVAQRYLLAEDVQPILATSDQRCRGSGLRVSPPSSSPSR